MPKSESTNKLLQNSSLYREFLAEREEIMRHKWLESEKAGIDIGFEEYDKNILSVDNVTEIEIIVQGESWVEIIDDEQILLFELLQTSMKASF